MKSEKLNITRSASIFKGTHRIPFNLPYMTGKETEYIYQALNFKKLSGNGIFTKRCQYFFEKRYGFGKCFLTSSCTDALEMSALLCDIKPGDEVIIPSFTFVSTANAFVLRGAKIVFVDSRKDHPNMDEELIEDLITEKTKVIVPVHYAGIACNMDKIMSLAEKFNLLVVEDAAHAIDSYYTGKDGVKRALGSIGHFATFSFHETKNIISGEGGMLVVNDNRFQSRAEIIWEKGTNRSAFFRGEIDKYGWIDIGSSFLPSEITAAFLWAQLENLDDIQEKRKMHWYAYYNGIKKWASNNDIGLPVVPGWASNNAHAFYLVCKSADQRSNLINYLKINRIMAVFHYLSLHKSEFFKNSYVGKELLQSDRYSERLVRLPLYYELEDADEVVSCLLEFDQS